MQLFQLEHKIDLKLCINFIFATFSVITTHVLPMQCEKKNSSQRVKFHRNAAENRRNKTLQHLLNLIFLSACRRARFVSH